MANGNIASYDLTWLLIKGGNSFTHKRVGAFKIFSSEPGNLTNIHAHKFSGLANARTLDIAASPSGTGVTVSVRKAGASPYAVKDAVKSKKVKGKGGRKTAGKVVAIVGDEKEGRLDLRKAALARASAILASQSTRKALRQRASRGTKVAAVDADEE